MARFQVRYSGGNQFQLLAGFAVGVVDGAGVGDAGLAIQQLVDVGVIDRGLGGGGWHGR